MLAQLNGYFDLPCCLQNKTKTIDAINQKSKVWMVHFIFNENGPFLS